MNLFIQNFNLMKIVILLVYEELDNPSYVEKILKKINLEKSRNMDLQFFINRNKKELNIEYDQNIFDKSQLLYQNFLKSC